MHRWLQKYAVTVQQPVYHAYVRYQLLSANLIFPALRAETPYLLNLLSDGYAEEMIAQLERIHVCIRRVPVLIPTLYAPAAFFLFRVKNDGISRQGQRL